MIVGRRDPLKAFLLALCVMSGARFLLAPPDHGLMPWWGLMSWYLALVVFGSAGLIGVVWPDPITGLLIERVALAGLGVVGAAYALGLVVHGGMGEVWQVVTVGLFAAACFAKAGRITADLRRHRG